MASRSNVRKRRSNALQLRFLWKTVVQSLDPFHPPAALLPRPRWRLRLLSSHLLPASPPLRQCQLRQCLFHFKLCLCPPMLQLPCTISQWTALPLPYCRELIDTNGGEAAFRDLMTDDVKERFIVPMTQA